MERNRGLFTFVKQRGFKRCPRTSHHSRVAMFKAQECVEPEFVSKGRPSGGESVSNISASSLEPATMTFNPGSKGPKADSHKVKGSQNVVVNRSGANSQTSPSKVIPAGGKQPGQIKARDQQGHSEAHAVSKSSG